MQPYKKCKKCNISLDEKTCVPVCKDYIRSICKKCRSKQVMEYNKNSENRKNYMNERARRIGKVNQYPCETCEAPCYKKYAKAFCSIKCRFLSYVNKAQNCWIWIGAQGRRGYGKFVFDKENTSMPAHRASYILFNDAEFDKNLFICHSCDNPSCVNPEHLWVGTPEDNAQDCIKKGRHRWQKRRENAL